MTAIQTDQNFEKEIAVFEQLRSQPQLLKIVTESKLPELALQKQLREEYHPDLVRSAMTLRELRERASIKFTRSAEMWFDRKGLEQATPEAVADHKAHRFSKYVRGITDLCCGIGSDSLALARRRMDVTSVDLSPVSCLFTRWNSQVYGVSERIETIAKDVRELDISDHWIHFDPDRRANHQRAVRLEEYSPPLEFLQYVTRHSPGGAIKLSPASNFGGKFPGCEIELVSLKGECKEATVWFGAIASSQPCRATILPDGFTIEADPADFYPEIGELGEYIYDPDPAIVRSGLVDAIAAKLDMLRLDDAEEYLTSETLVSSSSVTPFRVLEKLPNNPREIGKSLRRNPCGELEIKCRHVPVNVEQLRRKLPILGSGRKTLLIARISGKTHAVIAERLPHRDD